MTRAVYEILAIVLSILALTSCSSISRNECGNIQDLVSWSSSDNVVELDYSLGADQFLTEIKSVLQKDCCWKNCPMGLRLSNNEVYSVYINEHCSGYGVIRCGILDPEIDILVNRVGAILLNHELTNTEGILKWRSKEEPDEWKTKGFQILWDGGLPIDTLNAVFSMVKHKYIEAWDKLAIQMFQVDFCSLDSTSLITIRDQIPFKIKLTVNSFPDMEIVED